MRRFNIFSENLKKYEEHNQSGASWTMGVNQFSDLTEAEFEAFHMGGYKVGRDISLPLKWLIFGYFEENTHREQQHGGSHCEESQRSARVC